MRIRYLLTNVLGGGGTIATTIANANTLASRGHQVEIASVIRRRDAGIFAVDPRVSVLFLTDLRRGSADRGNPDRALPSAEVPQDESRAHVFSKLSDERVRDYLQRADGIILATRPALNLMLARHGRPDTIRIGMEHVNLAHHQLGSAQFLLPQMRQWYQRLDAFVTLTQADAADYRALLPGLHVETVPNAATTIDLGLTASTRNHVVVSAGRLTSQKGFDRLIAAFARVKDAHPGWQLHIYGRGAAQDSLQAAIDRAGGEGQIQLMGFTTSLPRTLADSGFLAMASRFEGLPMVMLEAMGVGLPIVTYDFSSGPRDLVQQGENGLIVPDGDEDALAEGLARLMADDRLRVDMGRRSMQLAAQFSPEAVTVRWESLLRGLQAERR